MNTIKVPAPTRPHRPPPPRPSSAALGARTLIIATTLLSATAAADTLVAVAADDGPPLPRRVEGRLGFMLGGSDVGNADGFSLGVSTGLGVRYGDVTLRAALDHFRVGDGSMETLSRRGRATRLAGLARYSFANTYEHDRRDGGFGVDFWGELGGGIEHIAWKPGGVLDRPSAELAVGFEVDAYGRRKTAAPRQRHLGYFLAFRTFVARGPEIPGEAVCGGPCDRATRPSRVDLSMFFEMGMHWGK
jgi:hypothetical protein